MSTVPNAEDQLQPILGQIKLSWKDAVAETLTKRWRRHLLQTLVLSSIVGIFMIHQEDLDWRPLRWLLVVVFMFIINVSEDARLQRKASRNSWRFGPADKRNWAE